MTNQDERVEAEARRIVAESFKDHPRWSHKGWDDLVEDGREQSRATARYVLAEREKAARVAAESAWLDARACSRSGEGVFGRDRALDAAVATAMERKDGAA